MPGAAGALVNRLILVCGMPGAGKTTLARDLAARHGAVRLDADEWFLALGWDPHDGPLRDRFEALQWEQAQELLRLGTSVVLENGVWLREHRDEKRLVARRLGVLVELHVLDVPLAERWRRIENRNRLEGGVRMTRDQLESWDRYWEPPTADEQALYDEPPVSSPATGALSVPPVLVLTGGPAVGKSATAAELAATQPRCAVVEVDDVRQLVRHGAAAPWEGEEGRRQQALGVRNACALARELTDAGIGVVVADVLTPDTAALYRRLLPRLVVVHLVARPEEVRRRAATRPVYLTEAEFVMLHAQDEREPPPADVRLDVTGLSLEVQARKVREAWEAGAVPRRNGTPS